MSQRIVIFGNSGSGKTTLASAKTQLLGFPTLDLDTIAWQKECETPVRKPLSESGRVIEEFLVSHDAWIIEGCYSDLLNLVIPYSTEVIFLNPGIETCIRNCRNRPWEPHKYPSRVAQDANLEMLILWVEGYNQRDDEFSLASHRELFDGFTGMKQEIGPGA